MADYRDGTFTALKAPFTVSAGTSNVFYRYPLVNSGVGLTPNGAQIDFRAMRTGEAWMVAVDSAVAPQITPATIKDTTLLTSSLPNNGVKCSSGRRQLDSPMKMESVVLSSCGFLVGHLYKVFTYVVGNYTAGVDGTLSPHVDVVLPTSNRLTKYYLTSDPTSTGFSFKVEAEDTAGKLWAAVYPLSTFDVSVMAGLGVTTSGLLPVSVI
jgi:hypothetical protein